MIKGIQIPYNDLFEMKCKFASEGGFDGIAVNFTEFLDKTEYEWEKLCEEIQIILDKYNLKCVQSHPYYYDLLISSEIIEDRYEFAIKQAIIATGKLGGAWAVLHPRSSVTSGFFTSKAFEDNRRVFDGYLELAHKYNTGIAAENLPMFKGIYPDMQFYSCICEDHANLIDSFNDERMKACWDTGHANMMYLDQAEAIKYMGNRIKCTHIHNNFRRLDDHLPPSNGTIDWQKVMSAFASVGYDGPLTLETGCSYNDPGLIKSFFKHGCECLDFLERYVK